MKVLGIVIAALMLVGTLFVGLAGANKSFDLASELDKVNAELSGAEAEMLKTAVGDMPSPGKLKTGGILTLVGCLGALATFIAIFAKRSLVLPLAVITIVASAVAIVIYPTVPTGPLDGMAPKTQQIVATIMAAIGAGGAFLAKVGADKKAAASASGYARAA